LRRYITVDGAAAVRGGAQLTPAFVASFPNNTLLVVVGDTPVGGPAGRGFTGEIDELRITSGDGLKTAAYFDFDEAYGRGLHSFTFQLNVSAFCGMGGALRDSLV